MATSSITVLRGGGEAMPKEKTDLIPCGRVMGQVLEERVSTSAVLRPRPLQVMGGTSPQPPGISKEDQARSREQLWQELTSDPLQWLDNRSNKRSPGSPDYSHKCTKEILWITNWANPPRVKGELSALIQGRTQSDEGSVHDGASGREYNRIPCLNEAQLCESRIPTITTAFERGSTEGLNNNSSGTHGVLKTLCKAGRLKEAVHILNQQGIWANLNTYVCLLQECINMKGLAEGRQVHAHIIQSGFKPNVFLLNTLVNMYAKCGSVVDARQVFDKMPERDMITWNAMIAGYAKHGCGTEAFKIYEQMQEEGVTPNRVTLICILNACGSLGALPKGKEVHADIIKAKVPSDIVLETSLADMYAKCGSMRDALQVFNNMAKRNLVSWSVMIAGYAQQGQGREALEMYEEMIQEGVTPDKVTFICILNACASLGVLEKGKEVHADIAKAGAASDIILETALADMYAKCGSIKDARKIFDNMADRNVVSWNVIIVGYAQHGFCREAFQMYEQMVQQGVTPNNATFICVLKACACLGILEKVKDVHADIKKSGSARDIILYNSLVATYAKCGSIKDARQVFDGMAQRDVISWSTMIAGYSQQGCGGEAFEIYEQMIREGVTPNHITFICVLGVCASLAALDKGTEIHAAIIKAGIVPDIILETALVDMYAKCGSMKDARQLLDNMAGKDVVSYSAIIAGYAQHGCGREAFEIYEQMIQEGVTPNKVTYISILKACASLAALEKGIEVHADIIKAGVAPDIILETALVDMYAKCGRMKDAQKLFDSMSNRDVVAWNAMITGYAQHGCGREALQLFGQMEQEEVKPDNVTFLCLLSACSHVGLVQEGSHYFGSMSQDYGLTPTVEHFGCLVDLLGRGGQLAEAEDLINKMPIEPDASVWGALLGACRIHDDVERAEHAAKCLLKSDPQHTASYVLLSNIYAAAGRWDDQAKVRQMMKDRCVREEPGHTYVEVDTQVRTFV